MPSLIATAAFGVEAVVKREVQKLGYKNAAVSDGHINFEAGIEAVADLNIRLRCADRVLIKIGSFNAVTFDSLFEQTKALPWDEWITADGKFTVTARSVRSGLFSVSDIQSIVKKAVVEKLKQKYNVSWFDETGPEYAIRAALMKDEVTLTIDTTGAGQGLHKRGYRRISVGAPIKETLAAAMIDLTYWRPNRLFLDPCCGSGTIPIEAAMIAKNIAPGLSRSFVSEKWPQIGKEIWKKTRASAYAEIKTDFTPEIFGSDIDPGAVKLSIANAEAAGVDDCIRFETKPFKDVELPGEYGTAVINPPYGERMGRMKDVELLYSEMGRLFRNAKWSVYVLTADEFFETSYGMKAGAKRKLFNGNVKTDLYQYIAGKPPVK
jgi:putative N6-adenine-specific DNA methylase